MLRGTILLALTLAGCKLGGDDFDMHDGDRNAALRETLDLNIKKTRAFFVQGAEQTNQTSTNCGNQPCQQNLAKLVAVQDDGTVVEVKVTADVNASNVSARGVMDSPMYLFFFYDGVMYKGKQCQTIPVRKSDGAMFCVTSQYYCGDAPCNNNNIQSTPDGKYIYTLANWTLSRLELKGIDDSQQIEIASQSSGGMVNSMVVNHDGDLLTTVSKDGGNNVQDVRYYRAGGGFVNVARGLQGAPCVLTGPGSGDDFYWTVGDTDGPGGQVSSVNRIFRSGTDVTSATIASDPNNSIALTDCWGRHGLATTNATYVNFNMNNGNNGSTTSVTEVLNASGVPRRIDFPNLTSLSYIAACSDHLVMSAVDKDGNDVLQRYFPSVPTTQTLAASKDYVVTKLAVDSSCRITFGGRRAYDNARLVGQIEPGSDTVDIVAKDLSADVTQILAIH